MRALCIGAVAVQEASKNECKEFCCVICFEEVLPCGTSVIVCKVFHKCFRELQTRVFWEQLREHCDDPSGWSPRGSEQEEVVWLHVEQSQEMPRERVS